MDDKVLFGLIWRLAMREHQMLCEVLPATQEMAACLRKNEKPDPEQLKQWIEIEHRVHRNFGELTESIAGIEQMARQRPYHLDL